MPRIIILRPLVKPDLYTVLINKCEDGYVCERLDTRGIQEELRTRLNPVLTGL